MSVKQQGFCSATQVCLFRTVIHCIYMQQKINKIRVGNGTFIFICNFIPFTNKTKADKYTYTSMYIINVMYMERYRLENCLEPFVVVVVDV